MSRPPVTLNQIAKALIDTGCSRTPMKKAKDLFTPEVLHMQCIHGDIREYRTKVVTISIGTLTFTCRVGVVP